MNNQRAHYTYVTCWKGNIINENINSSSKFIFLMGSPKTAWISHIAVPRPVFNQNMIVSSTVIGLGRRRSPISSRLLCAPTARLLFSSCDFLFLILDKYLHSLATKYNPYWNQAFRLSSILACSTNHNWNPGTAEIWIHQQRINRTQNNILLLNGYWLFS